MLAFSVLLGCSGVDGPWAGAWHFETSGSAEALTLDGVIQVLAVEDTVWEGEHLTRTAPPGQSSPSGVLGPVYGQFTGAQWQLELRERETVANDTWAWSEGWVVMELTEEAERWVGQYRLCAPELAGACAVQESGPLTLTPLEP